MSFHGEVLVKNGSQIADLFGGPDGDFPDGERGYTQLGLHVRGDDQEELCFRVVEL